jgi:hypothetical protein
MLRIRMMAAAAPAMNLARHVTDAIERYCRH